MNIINRDTNSGFTRIELLVVTITLLMLFIVGAANLFGQARKATVSYCKYNLMQCYAGLKSFAEDHDGKLPWKVINTKGGSADDLGRYKNNFKHWQVLSNYLKSPQIVRCSVDSGRIQANSWLDKKPKDFENFIPFNGNRTFSYFIASDSILTGPDYVLAGSRNLSYGKYLNDSDSKGSIKRFKNAYPPSSNIKPRWSASLHSGKGMLLMSSGHVNYNTLLADYLKKTENKDNIFHLPAKN